MGLGRGWFCLGWMDECWCELGLRLDLQVRELPPSSLRLLRLVSSVSLLQVRWPLLWSWVSSLFIGGRRHGWIAITSEKIATTCQSSGSHARTLRPQCLSPPLHDNVSCASQIPYIIRVRAAGWPYRTVRHIYSTCALACTCVSVKHLN
jgi:hypothetical protein